MSYHAFLPNVGCLRSMQVVGFTSLSERQLWSEGLAPTASGLLKNSSNTKSRHPNTSIFESLTKTLGGEESA